MNIKKFFLSVFFIFIFIFNIVSIPSINMKSLNGKEFQIGDTFEVEINLEDNTGAYGIFLDVNYNSNVLELIDVFQGDLLPENPDKCEFLFAESSINGVGRIVISNTLVGNQNFFYDNGNIVKLIFRTVRSSDDTSITFNDKTSIYINDMAKKDFTAKDLNSINVIGAYTDYFIQIISPYNNYKSTNDKIDYSIQTVIKNPKYKDDFKIGLKRVSSYNPGSAIIPGTTEIFVKPDNGYAVFQRDMNGMFKLSPGYNYVEAVLYINDEIKAQTVKRIYYESSDRGVQILTPVNNCITGKSVITIEGKSTFNNVTVNNIKAGDINRINNDNYSFIHTNQRLKEGFNKITARTVNPQASEIIYKDVIIVYYQRDESIFNFINPMENEVFKVAGDNSSDLNKLIIRGLIDTIDTDLITVKMRTRFRSFGIADEVNYVYRHTDMEDGDIVLRELQDNENYLLSHYIFEAEYDLNKLKGLGSGELTFYAVKIDKTGKNEEIEISRKVIINSESLKIDLKQPNLFSKEIINSKTDIEKYYPSNYTPNSNIVVSETGRISLVKNENSITYDDLENENIIDLVVTSNKETCVISNSNNNRIDVYKKNSNEKYFDKNNKKSFFNAYANCAVEFGNNSILIGISNYNDGINNNSGLILLNNGILRYVKLPFVINHVQYIKRVENEYYLYSSNFTYLYKFSENDVVIDPNNDSYFEIKKVDKFYIPNNYFINDIVINENKNMFAATERGIRIYQYNAFSNSYSLKKIIKEDKEVLYLSKAYLSENYNTYLFAYKDPVSQDDVYISTINESKNQIAETEYNQITYESVYSIIHKKNNIFVIYGREAGQNTLREVAVFNGVEKISAEFILDDMVSYQKNHIYYENKNNMIFFGNGLSIIAEEYSDENGIIELLFHDQYVDGITGFSFDLPAAYENLASIEYCLTNNIEDDDYELFVSAGIPVMSKELSHYEYTINESYKYLKLKITLSCSDNKINSAFLENLSVMKKEIVMTTSKEIDIKGFILDKTVGESDFTINSMIVDIEDNGSFYNKINLNESDIIKKFTPVRLYAVNKIGETDEINFKIIHVENDPDISGIILTHSNDNTEDLTVYPADGLNDYAVVDSSGGVIKLNGKYSGLMGVQVSAEIYTRDSENNISKFVKSYSAELPDNEKIIIDGIESGSFYFNNIELIPGVQKIILRCMNPYGTKKEVKFDIDFKVQEEKIEILNYEIKDEKITTFFNVSKNDNNEYCRTFELIGKLITDKPVDYINLRSDNQYISFSKGDERDVNFIKIPLGEIEKTFSVYVNLRMNDDNESLSQYFKIWPESIQLAQLKRFIFTDFSKVFKEIKPDFSSTIFNEETGEINLKFKFNEPVPNTMLIKFRLNHSELDSAYEYMVIKKGIDNEFFNYENGIYSYNKLINAVDGINIIDWWFYRDNFPIGEYDEKDQVLSYSGSTDYLEYNYIIEDLFQELYVDFPDKEIFYNMETLKEDKLEINFDKRGILNVFINDKIIKDISDFTTDNIAEIDLSVFQEYLIEGLNRIDVTYYLESKNINDFKRSEFKYDSLPPKVSITSVDATNDFVTPYIISITAEVLEDNLENVSLIYNNSIIKQEPKITFLDNNKYLYTWNHLENLNIIPSKQKNIYVKAVDITGKEGISRKIDCNVNMYYDIQLSNKLSDNKVLNYPDIQITGTDDNTTDFSQYRNEQDKSFDYHLKYETTKLTDDADGNLRVNITNNFSKDLVFDSLRKYLMFEFDNVNNVNDIDLAYKREIELNQKKIVTPVNMLIHERYDNYKYMNAYDVTPNNPDDSVYSIVNGYKSPISELVGTAEDIKLYRNFAFVYDYLEGDQNNPDDDYKSIIVYDLNPILSKAPNVPEIKAIIDDDRITNLRSFRIYGNFLYAVCGDDGIIIYNLKNLDSADMSVILEYVADIKITEENGDSIYFYDIVKKGDYLFIAAGDEGIKVFDLRMITNPVEIDVIHSLQVNPISFFERENYIYAVGSSSKIAKYEITGDNISAELEIADLDFSGVFNQPKIWYYNGLIYVLPRKNIRVFRYSIDPLTFHDRGVVCNNEFIKTDTSILYPVNDGIRVYLDPDQKTNGFLLNSGKTNALVFNNDNGVIYSASSDDGLKVIKAEYLKEDDLIEGDGIIPAGWNNDGEVLPVHYQDQYHMEGVVNLNHSYNLHTKSCKYGKISKYIDPPVLVRPDNEFKAEFQMGGGFFIVGIKFKESGLLYKTYYTDASGIKGTVSTIEGAEEAGNRTFTFSEFGLDKADSIEYIIFITYPSMIPSNAPDSEEIVLGGRIDSVAVPEYRSFMLPITHASFDIDEELGQSETVEIDLELFKTENSYLTNTGKSMTYFPLQDESSEFNVKKAFDEISESSGNNGQFEGVDFTLDYFTERMTKYVTGQCQNNQYDDTDAEFGNIDYLSDINDENKNKFENSLTNIFRRNNNNAVRMGSVVEDLFIKNSTEDYKVFLTDTLIIQSPTEGDRISEKTSKQFNIKRSKNGAVSFWLRLEDEIPYFENMTVNGTDRLWYDYRDKTGQPVVSWGGENPEDANYRFVIHPQNLSFIQYKQGSGINKDNSEFETNNIIITPLSIWQGPSCSYGKWMLVTLTWDHTGGLVLYLNNKRINEIPHHMFNFNFDSFLHDKIIFGHAGQKVDSMYYSVASPKIYNYTLSDDNVTALYNAFNRLQGEGEEIKIGFNSTLMTDPPELQDKIISDIEYYENTFNGQGIVVTKGINNYIANDFENKKLMLSDSLEYDSLIKEEASCDYDPITNIIILNNENSSDESVYHMTDGGKTGLGIPGAESYTFFGELLTSNLNENDVCIIKINGKENKFNLKTGSFKFTVENPESILTSIDIYFKYSKDLQFKAESFGFNIGRYKGNNFTGYPENNVRLKHDFHHKESVIVYYEPLFKNNYELNNEEIVILDSKVYKIGISGNKYYAVLKTSEGEIKLEADDLVTGGLHQFAVLYDFSSLAFKFYIDAKLEAEYKGPVFNMPLDIGAVSDVYNVTLGGSLDDTVKAQGIIDDFEIYTKLVGEGFLQSQFYKRTNIIDINNGPIFNSADVVLELRNVLDDNINIEYYFDNDFEDSNSISINSNDIEIIDSNFSVGEHILNMNISLNTPFGKINKKEMYKFYVSYAPMLRLTENKSIIIEGDYDFVFELERDLESNFAEKDQFIELQLYMADNTEDLTNPENLKQTIIEDRLNVNFGKYFTDNNYSTLTDHIKFIKTYDPGEDAESIYYRIISYFYDNTSEYFEITGEVKILNLRKPEITIDPVTKRPWIVKTGIDQYDKSFISNNLKCDYEILKLDAANSGYQTLDSGSVYFDNDGNININVYNYASPGNYKVKFEPFDIKGNRGDFVDKEYTINGTDNNKDDNDTLFSDIWIDTLEMIFLDKENNSVKYNFSGGVSKIKEDEHYLIDVVLVNEADNTETVILSEQLNEGIFKKIISLDNLKIGSTYLLMAKLKYGELEEEKSERIRYEGRLVDVAITHGAKGYISYNNLYFNWEGYLDGELNNGIGFMYSIDNSPWGYTNNNHVEFYNLEDGFHVFKVRAYFQDHPNRIYSAVRNNSFYIDTKRPVINEDKIEIIEVYDDSGIISHLKLTAQEGAVEDKTLADVLVNGTSTEITNGGFTVEMIPLEKDGNNEIIIEAVDILNNLTKIKKIYNFEILNISYPVSIKDLEEPKDNEFVKYSPLTVYGKISDKVNITDDTKIYVDDPYGRRYATINFDRTFYIENVKINPGTKFKGIKTELTFHIEFKNGKVFSKEYPVYAKDVIKPIKLDLSIHAVAGGAESTEVKMTATTDVDNISCWSFDYDGDGIYEDEYFTNEKTLTVFHKYSIVGMIHPRVRIITNDNQFFSGDDTLIIHDKIIKADIKTIPGVKSIDIIEIDDENNENIDGYEYVYLLQEIDGYNIVKRYIIEANNAVLLDNNSISINLTSLGINYPEIIKVDSNYDIYISCLEGSGSRLYKLIKTLAGYKKDADFNISFHGEVISSFDLDNEYVYISKEKSSELAKYNKSGEMIFTEIPDMNGIIEPVSVDYGVVTNGNRLWLADYRNQRILSVSNDTFKLRNFFGQAGNGEGEFISPKIIRVIGNYIYVLDQSEKTIQVFENINNDFRIMCRIDYMSDYLPNGFLNYITDFAVFTKLENKKRYHYLSLVNNQTEQVALLRIPGWQSNSIKVRANLITYVKNNEIYISKPDGADVKKIFSSGSLPGVDGKMDYPSIAPDGKTITFVSKIEKYEYQQNSEETVFNKYDKLYIFDLIKNECSLVDHPLINGKEIDRPQFSYNGSKIIFSAKGSNEYWTIYEYDIKTKELTKLFNPSSDCLRPTYSPDDRYIAYVTKFHNHNEIVIYDNENPDLLISLTNNDYSDDYPVWAPVYPGEISDDNSYITSKIAFVSKPDFKEKIFYTYISQRSFGDFRIVKSDGSDIGGDPDQARNELEIDYNDSDTISYPCFTGDGKVIIYETYKNGETKLMQYNMENNKVSYTGTPEGSRKPAGMKNRIVNYSLDVADGNNLQLNWDRYADEDLIYTVEYISSESDANLVEKSYKSQDGALIEDLKMGLTYYVRVYIKDLLRGGEITTSIWKKAVIYPVIAKPIITIDENNPYLVKMKAWKPESDTPWEYNWKFKWYIDNYKVEENNNDTFEYEFAAAGIKRIALEASVEGEGSKTHRSEDILIDIKGDLEPVIDCHVYFENDQLKLKLDASKSSGLKIDRSNYRWKLSGSNVNGNLPPEEFSGDSVIRNISNYSGNLYVTLTVTSLPVTGQVEVIREEKSITELIPIGLNEIKPVIIDITDANDPSLYTFDGSKSIGNIDWLNSSWEIFGPNNLHYQDHGKKSFTYKFPESNSEVNYTVVLNARNRSNSSTVMISKMITVGEVPVIPVIDYKVITSNESGETVTAKLLLSAASSRGNDIDWNTVRWSVPLAGDFGGSSSQSGATAVYNLYNIKKGMAVDVNLTMQRRISGEIIELNEIVNINNNEVPSIIPYIELEKESNIDLYENQDGDVYIFSALNSKGANIDWNNVSWLIDGQYTRQGSVVRVDLKDSAENKQNIIVTLTLRSAGGGEPVSKTLSFDVESKRIRVVISNEVKVSKVEAGEKNIAKLSVRDSIGRNIDWERTKWFIYEGPENIVEKYGAEIIHALPISSEKEYYPAMVQMFYKDSTKPFSKMFNIVVKGNRFKAIIKEEYNEELNDMNMTVRTFTAADSLGENIDWQNAKWTFGDSSEYQYGPVVTHKFPLDKNINSYKVTLTLTRKKKSGETEISTDTYDAVIGRDVLKANITVKQDGNYVVFSSEESCGRGLLLDRSIWIFEGPDSETYNETDSGSGSQSYGLSSSHTTTTSFNFGTNVGYSAGIKGGAFFSASYGFEAGLSNSNNLSSSDTNTVSWSQSSNESSNNIYSGASCRKMINGWKSKRVTLIVYRALPDGTIEAQSKSFIYYAGQSDITVLQ